VIYRDIAQSKLGRLETQKTLSLLLFLKEKTLFSVSRSKFGGGGVTVVEPPKCWGNVPCLLEKTGQKSVWRLILD
jgi:hypothetical protein